jgi:hypothetical protein
LSVKKDSTLVSAVPGYGGDFCYGVKAFVYKAQDALPGIVLSNAVYNIVEVPVSPATI